MGTIHIGSQPWPSGITWCNWSSDLSIPRWPFPIGAPLSQVAIFSRLRDNGHQTCRGHDLVLSGSRDLIGHVTIRFPGGHFLYVLHCYLWRCWSSGCPVSCCV